MAIFEEIPVPGMYRGDTYQPDELLYSEARYTQKGMTLPAGNGEVWEMGSVMACNDNDGLYYPIGTETGEDGNATNLGPAEGLLRHSVKLYADRRQFQDLMISGIAKLEKVHGYTQQSLDELGAVISTRRSTFKF